MLHNIRSMTRKSVGELWIHSRRNGYDMDDQICNILMCFVRRGALRTAGESLKVLEKPFSYQYAALCVSRRLSAKIPSLMLMFPADWRAVIQ